MLNALEHLVKGIDELRGQGGGGQRESRSWERKLPVCNSKILAKAAEDTLAPFKQYLTEKSMAEVPSAQDEFGAWCEVLNKAKGGEVKNCDDP